MNAKKAPQLIVATGATKWNDPRRFPWTMGWQPSYQSEAHISLKDLELSMLLPGMRINTGPNDFAPIKHGERFELFRPVMSGEVGG
jgi:hypothetical protein